VKNELFFEILEKQTKTSFYSLFHTIFDKICEKQTKNGENRTKNRE
jgi:uncharacterized protein YaaR (DUF327 family)